MNVMERGIAFYEVSDGERWWTVSGPAESGWGICNETLRVVSPDGRLGKKIIGAVEKFQQTQKERSDG